MICKSRHRWRWYETVRKGYLLLMKTDFKKFRQLRIVAIVLVTMAFLGFTLCMIFIGGALGAGFGILSMVGLGFSGALCEYAAYDCLICPYCGQRAVKSHREFPSDKENKARFAAIIKGLSFECVHCRRMINPSR